MFFKPSEIEIHNYLTTFLDFTLVGFIQIFEDHELFDDACEGTLIATGEKVIIFPVLINENRKPEFFVEGELFQFEQSTAFNVKTIQELKSRLKKEHNKVVVEAKKNKTFDEKYVYYQHILEYGTDFQKFLSKRINEEYPFMIFLNGSKDYSYVLRCKSRSTRTIILKELNNHLVKDGYFWYSN